MTVHGSSAVGAAVAATGGLYVTALVGAPVSAVLLPLVPLPGLLLGGRHGEGALVACVGLSTMVAAVLLGVEPALTYLLALGAPTLAATAALRRGWSVERTVLLGATAWSIAVAVLLLAEYGSPGQILIGVRERLQESFDLALSTSRGLGVADDMLADLAATRERTLTAVLGVLPGGLALAGALTMLLNVLIVRGLLPWLRVTDLRLWSAPPPLIWAFIAAGFGMFVPLTIVRVMAANAFIVVAGCYLCQGLAIASFYLERFRVSRGLRLATYVLIVTQQPLLVIAAVLGVFDLWVNFRRLGVIAETEADD